MRARWAALALGTLTLSATIASGAISAPALAASPAPYPGVAVQKDVPIVMRDGTKLYANVARPADANGAAAPGRFPTILTQTPYNKDAGAGSGLAGELDNAIKQGYAQVIVDVRGTGQSEGSWDSFGPQEQLDSMDIITWIHQQPWDNGSLALYGPSYMAINQFLTAEQHPPGLKAMFPIIPGSDLYRDVTWHGGSVDAGFIPLWLGLVTALKEVPPSYATSDPNEALKLELERLTGGFEFPVNAFTSGTIGGDLAFDGPFYWVRDPITKIDQVNVPTFIVGGLWDLFQRGEPQLYNALRLPPGSKQLLIGPWYHITAGQGLGQPGTPPAMQDLALAWFDHWVKGIDNGIQRFGPVTLYQLGPERWTTQDSYPGPVDYQRLYLSPAKSGSATSLNDGTLTSALPAATATQTMPANQVNGYCSRSTTQWTAGLVTPGSQCQEDTRLTEATGLTYTTAAQTRPLRLVGPLSLTLRSSTTARDTTWIATVTDVAPDGTSRSITAGWLMPSRRAVDATHSFEAPNGDLVIPFHPFTRASLEPVNPGEPETLNIEIFPTDVVVQPGHRLRLVLTSGDVPHLLAATPDAINSAGAIDSVDIDPTHASYLTVPVAAPSSARLLANSGGGAASGAGCLARLPYAFHVHQNNGRVTHVVVYVDHRRVQSVRGQRITTVSVTPPARPNFTVKIVARTVKGKRVVSRRRYRGCVKHRPRTVVRHGSRA